MNDASQKMLEANFTIFFYVKEKRKRIKTEGMHKDILYGF